MTIPALRTEHLTKRFGWGSGARLALDGLDLSVEPGQVYGFLGKNGAGKTHLLRALYLAVVGESGVGDLKKVETLVGDLRAIVDRWE